MKPLHSTLLLFCALAVAGVTSAYLMIGKSAPSAAGEPTLREAQREPLATDSAHELAAPSTSGRDAVSGAASGSPCDVAKELRDVKSELALIRRELERGGATLDSASTTPTARPNIGDGWTALVREAEERLLIDTILRHRDRARVALRQEEASAVDADAAPEVQSMARSAAQNLQRALQALDDVQTVEQLSQWREEFSIEPLD